MNLYNAIKEVAKGKGVSIYKIEHDLNFSNGSICKWNETIPNANRLQKVANYLGVTISFLLDKSEKQIVKE